MTCDSRGVNEKKVYTGLIINREWISELDEGNRGGTKGNYGIDCFTDFFLYGSHLSLSFHKPGCGLAIKNKQASFCIALTFHYLSIS